MLLSFSLSILFSILLILNPTKAHALSQCKSIQPNVVSAGTKRIDLVIYTEGLVKKNNYRVKIKDPNGRENFVGEVIIGNGQDFNIGSNDEISIPGLNSAGYFNNSGFDSPFIEGAYEVKVQSSDTFSPSEFCKISFKVEKASSGGGSCTIKFTNTDQEFTNTNDLKITLDPAPASDSRILLERNENEVRIRDDDCFKANELNQEINLGKHENGTYTLEIKDGCALLRNESTACFTNFIIPGGVTRTGTNEIFRPPPCAAWKTPEGEPIPTDKVEDPTTNRKVCAEFSTAFGPIQVDLPKFVQRIFGIILGISGGLALILIIISGYRIMVSQGNPEALKGAREQLTAALIGLMLIIFSTAILQIIGVDILHIPGFGP